VMNTSKVLLKMGEAGPNDTMWYDALNGECSHRNGQQDHRLVGAAAGVKMRDSSASGSALGLLTRKFVDLMHVSAFNFTLSVLLDHFIDSCCDAALLLFVSSLAH
jgi:hypothetical protein